MLPTDASPPEGKPPRRKRLTRDAAAKKFPLRLTPEDLEECLVSLYQARLLSSDQLCALYRARRWGNTPRGAHYEGEVLKRLRRLYDHRYVDRVAHRGRHVFNPELGVYGGSERLVYALGRAGGRELGHAYPKLPRRRMRPDDDDRELRPLTIDHQLELSNLFVTLRVGQHLGLHRGLAFWRQGRPLEDEFCTDDAGRLVEHPSASERKELQTHRVSPDAFCCLNVPDPERPTQHLGRYYFVESDRSSMSGNAMLAKYRAYVQWFKHKRHTRKHQIKFFTVLTLTVSPQRRDELREKVAKLDRADAPTPLLWFCCQKDFSYQAPQKLFAPIWYTAHSNTPRRLLT